MTDFGAEIATNGVRPDYVRDDEIVEWSHRYSKGTTTAGQLHWDGGCIRQPVTSIRLRADHPYYLVAQHPGMKLHTGDVRPVDVDTTQHALLRNGFRIPPPFSTQHWEWNGDDGDILGYHPLPTSPSVEQGDDDLPDGAPQWAFNRADQLMDHESAYRALARYIAQHETPPVDEATELWGEAQDAICNSATADGDQAGIAILHAYLAKVRSEAA